MGKKIIDTIESSFAVVLIRDEEISAEPMVFFVYNLAEPRSGWNDEKPAGFGLPGGGVKREGMLEDFPEGAITEVGDETGLAVIRQSVREISGPHYKLIQRRRGSGTDKPTYIPFKRGQMPAIPAGEVMLGETRVFALDVEFEGTKLQDILRHDFFRFDNDGFRGSICMFESLSPEEVDSLGIHEVDEIAGIALLPVSLVFEMEEGNIESNIDYYLSHIQFAVEGLRFLGLQPAETQPADLTG